uniref:uncharacterized protein C1orf112 homolog isoform X2 n=1 Tax=Podarcis muralis TaxID=64176 RepID=UPI0010A0B9AC|nr:uncharacterized protein C1orf112 homolog isoform X2 [Podarcis muralis]
MSQVEPETLPPPLSEVEGRASELGLGQLPTALPRLISMYQTSDSWTQRIGVLRILTEQFLPRINLSELEQAFFSKILPKTVQLFDLLIYELSHQATSVTSHNVELRETLRNHLQTLVHVLEALTGSVRHICTVQDVVPLEHVYSLPSSILHVIKNTFVHCKNSESLYSECLHLFSDLLQSLFKAAYALQKQFMELLEMVSVNSCAAEDSIAIIASAVHTLLEICSAISSIDHALHANTWKFIIRQSLKHKSLIKNSLKHSDILSGLCEDILFSFQSCLQLAEQMKRSGTEESIDCKLFQRTVKLCRFLANSLVHYTKEFTPFLADSCCQLHQTYLQIYSKFPPSLYAPAISKSHQDEIAREFLVTLDSLLPHLLSFRPFLEVALSKISELSPELHFPQCRLLLSVMDKLPSQPQDVQALWNTGSQLPEEIPRVSLFAALFLSLQQCPGELFLPVSLPAAMGTGQAEDLVTFYHYVCVHLCAFITSLSVSHFHLLECSLLEAVLGSNTITALLAMDVWCFLARYGRADLCAHHAFIIAHLIKACPAEHFQVSLLGVLLRRLLFLMTADHQVRFTQQFPSRVTENLILWQHLSLQALIPPLRQQVAHELFVAGFAQCQEWLSSKRSLEELPQVNTALSALLSLCQTAGKSLEVGQQTALVGIVGQFLVVLPATQILTLQTSLLQLNPPDHVLTAILDFLSSMGVPIIPPEFQEQILSKLSYLFSSLLANSSWLIHQHAIEAFTQFAQETSHEAILSQCLNSEEIKSKVVGFLSKTRLVEESAEARAERMKEENVRLKCHLREATADRQRSLTSEPSPKRTCYSASEEQYKSAIDAAGRTLEVLKALLQKGPPPIWFANKLETLQMTLNSLKNSIS